MCFGGGSRAPDPVQPPAPPQDPNISDLAEVRKKRMAQSGMAGGTLLTGPTGIENNQLNTGKGSLLGS
jgi:hypothetical protein